MNPATIVCATKRSWTVWFAMSSTTRSALAWRRIPVPGVGLARGWVAVGMAVTGHPPHTSVRALLTHTVLTFDVWMFGRKAHLRIRMLDLDFRDQVSEFLPKSFLAPAAALT